MHKVLIPLLFLIFSLASCSQRAELSSPEGYNFNSPEIIKLPGILNEISGISFNNGNPDLLYAEQDEDGKIFFFPPGSSDIKNSRFNKKGDYEDVSISNGKVYLLRSEGAIFSVSLDALRSAEASGVKEFTGLIPKAEYEGMFANPATGKIFILCKTCKADNPSKSVTGYILTMSDTALQMESEFQLNTKEISALLGGGKVVFRPSALALNSVTNEWYILSSVNKLLVITDEQWKVKQALKLDPVLFSQPEGIAFDNKQSLYISNERGQAESATVLKFLYQSNSK